MSLTLYLKWQLEEPLKLMMYGYETLYDVLWDKTQSILTQISMQSKHFILHVSHNSDDSEGSLQIFDALTTHAMDNLHTAALKYGIIVKDLAVINKQFKGQ